MSYDEYTVAVAITVPLLLLFYKYAVLRSYRFCRQFTLVKVSLLETYEKQIEKLEYLNTQLKHAVEITQEESGQFSFDLFSGAEESYKYIPIYTPNGEWEQAWKMSDWVNYILGKQFVQRGKEFLWVDELFSNDKLAKLPCETYLIKDYLPKRRANKKVRQQQTAGVR